MFLYNSLHAISSNIESSSTYIAYNNVRLRRKCMSHKILEIVCTIERARNKVFILDDLIQQEIYHIGHVLPSDHIQARG